MFRIALSFIALCSIASLLFLNYKWTIETPDISPIFISENKGNIATEKAPTRKSVNQKLNLTIDVAPTYARPLFNRERRKFTPKIIKQKTRTVVRTPKIKIAPVNELVLPSFTLSGIAIRPEGKSALITNNGTGKSLWLKDGEKIDEWKLTSIIENSVELEQQSNKIIINLYDPISNQSENVDPKNLNTDLLQKQRLKSLDSELLNSLKRLKHELSPQPK